MPRPKHQPSPKLLSPAPVSAIDIIAGVVLFIMALPGLLSLPASLFAVLPLLTAILLFATGILVNRRTPATSYLALFVNGGLCALLFVGPLVLGSDFLLLFDFMPLLGVLYLLLCGGFIFATKRSYSVLEGKMETVNRSGPAGRQSPDELDVTPGWDEAATKNDPKPPAPPDTKNTPNHPPPD